MNVLVLSDEYRVLSAMIDYILHFTIFDVRVKIAHSAIHALECVTTEEFDMVVNALVDEEESEKWKSISLGHEKTLLFIPRTLQGKIEQEKNIIMEHKKRRHCGN